MSTSDCGHEIRVGGIYTAYPLNIVCRCRLILFPDGLDQWLWRSWDSGSARQVEHKSAGKHIQWLRVVLREGSVIASPGRGFAGACAVSLRGSRSDFDPQQHPACCVCRRPSVRRSCRGCASQTPSRCSKHSNFVPPTKSVAFASSARFCQLKHTLKSDTRLRRSPMPRRLSPRFKPVAITLQRMECARCFIPTSTSY